MHDQSITLKLDLPEFVVHGTFTDQNGDLVIIARAKRLPACPDSGDGKASLHDRRNQLLEDRPLRDQRVFLLCEKRRLRCTHEILEGRSKQTIRDFLQTLQDSGRVKIVVTDMWDAYRQALRSYLPHALHIVDKFHVVRHANWAVDQVRRRGRKGRNASTKSPWWKARWHLLRKQEALTEHQRERVEALLQEDVLIRRAYKLKERLRLWYQHKSLERAASEFPNLVQAMMSSDIPEYKTLANTMLAWRTEILAYFLYPYTNGFTEGTNTKIKILKRIGYGIPSFQKLRNRILSYK